MSRLGRWLAAAALLSCGEREGSVSTATAAHGALGGEVAARVAGVDVSAALVARVASATGVSPAVAVERIVEDVLAARAAERAGLDRTEEVRQQLTAARARATVDRIREEARRSPPTDTEVAGATAAHWVAVDSPETFLAAHAVALRPKVADAAKEAAAKAVAAAVVAATAGAKSESEFRSRAEAVPHPDVELVVQGLDPVTADGRVALEGQPMTYDPRFAAGAAALAAPGAMSSVVESSFGWHVIYLIERRPEHRLPLEVRRRMFAEEIEAARAHQALEALEAVLRKKEPVSTESGLDTLLAEAVPSMAPSAPSPRAP